MDKVQKLGIKLFDFDKGGEDKAAFFAALMQVRDVVSGRADAADGGCLAAVAPALWWQ